MQTIIIAALITGIAGIIIGLFLGIAGEKLHVEVDEREVKIREALPGNNCGGCGYAGCDALAKAIALLEAPVNACPVGQAPVADKIAKIMGSDNVTTVKKTAFVRCVGDCDATKTTYNYVGPDSCKMMKTLPDGGSKSCTYGCLGGGECVKVCAFDAIKVINGVAVVDKEKCTACGKCILACPRDIIELVPYDSHIRVACSSKDKGKDVKAACSLGCIGCTLCTKQCNENAITVENFLAHIDYDKCIQCGKCMEKCPAKIIRSI